MDTRIWLRLMSGIVVILLLVQCAPKEPDPAVSAEATPAAQASMPQERGGEDEFGPYEPTPNWPQWSGTPGMTWGSTAGIFAETPNKIFIAQRGELPLPPKILPGQPVWAGGLRASGQEYRTTNYFLTVDANGKLIESWTWNDHLITHPHSVLISPYDPEKHVWIIDGDDANGQNLSWKKRGGGNQILKFTNDGKTLVMKLGERDVQATDEKHFGGPTGIAFLPDGSFFVSDGYVNSRVMKFDKNGKFLLQWGQPGESGKETRPSYMNTVHSVAVGADGRVYVSDRSNRRIQIFDQNGKYLDQWTNIESPYFLYASQDRHLWVSDGVYQKIVKYDLNGKFQYSWGTTGIPGVGSRPGLIFGVHSMSVDEEGNLYTAEVSNGRAQKFRPKKGADPAKMVGQPMKLTN